MVEFREFLSVFTSGEYAIRRLTMLAGSSQRSRGRIEEIWPFSTYPRFEFWSTKTSITASTQRLASVYNFEAVSPFRENSSSRPAPCFLLSEQTKRYGVPIVPEAKTDAEFVHQLSTAQGSRKVSSKLRIIIRSENVAWYFR